jgi:DNA-3-methyladenine glycosylase
MFGPAGIAYVYFTYGMHHCLNAVTGAEGHASAVLIRALEPMWGIRAMRSGAPGSLEHHKVASGPGRICRALAIDRTLNGTDLRTGPITIRRGDAVAAPVHRGTRIGLSTDDGREWRYWTDSRSVSRPPSRSPSPRTRT